MSEQKLQQQIVSYLNQSAEVKKKLAAQGTAQLIAAAHLITDSLRSGGKLLLCGNGGSAADCQHMAAELVGRLNRNFERPALPAIALTTDTSFLTAYANDCGYDGVFQRQVEALGRLGDVLIGISTSGGSKNIVLAFDKARELGLKTVALCGDRGILTEKADVAVRVPSDNTQHIQEAHLAVEHLLCSIIEQALFGAAS